ncbi:hypothetical protein NE237_032456 [Protea cynaroides]|uniref:Glycosyltransferase 61 catalytic domain-containing protein n=1 Tax=Protea cynaroides TaxID=273540 RepID=A0A9Q0L3E9_9MAGN|nr:hypothetical protein NE237_032456 [Protea cynaroides]
MGKQGVESRSWVGVTTATTIVVFLLPLLYAIVFFSNNTPLDFWKQVPYLGSECSCEARAGATEGSISNGGNDEKDDSSLTSRLGKLLRGNDQRQLETIGFGCKSDHMNDVCVSNQRVWMKTDNGNLSVYFNSKNVQPPQLQHQISLKVRPYVNKKNDEYTKEDVKEITIQTPMEHQSYNYTCDVTHDIPAVIFSTGLNGNIFHEFNEMILPLFLTCRHFRSQLQFVINDFNEHWVHKYRSILSHLSDYEFINASEDNRIHCFPGFVIGLHFHNENLVCSNSDLPVNCSMLDFRQFLRETFHLEIKNVSQLLYNNTKPELVLLSRRRSRMILNEAEIVTVASELGFSVVIADPELTSNMNNFSVVVNRCSVLVGAHGAGLTNELFIPDGAVVVQVVPLGIQWASTNYFGKPSKEMGVQYLEYQISPQESTLLDVYGPNHPIITDPDSIHRQGFNVVRPIYIEGQNITLNISNFKDTLVQALKLLGR